MELLTRNNFEGWMQKLMERLDRQIKKFTNGCVRVVNRWLPDAFLFAIILSIIVFIGSMRCV